MGDREHHFAALFHKGHATFVINTTAFELNSDITLKNIFG